MSVITRDGLQAGGAIQLGRSVYIERPADAALEAALAGGDYCLILAPRQVGKSSLRVNVSRRLGARGIATAVVDLSAIGVAGSAGEWYYSIAYEIAAAFDLAPALTCSWRAHSDSGTASLQFMHTLEEVVLERVSGPIAVFIDEVDMTLSQPFAHEDFFAVIRAMYNARADRPAWRRISICLLGVMTRADMAREARRTPFNIECTEIELDDFSRDELDVFAPALRPHHPQTAAILDAIHGWTRGHPALSQRLLAAVSSRARAQDDPHALVDALVDELFSSPGANDDPVLSDTARRFGRANDSTLHSKMIETYSRLLAGERVVASSTQLGPEGARTIAQLQLAGLVRRDERGYLSCRSRLVRTLFDAQWLRSVQADRLLSEDLHRWLDHDRHPGFLLENERLTAALDWARGRHDLSDAERDFLLESEELAKRRSERQAQRRRRLSIMLAGLSLALLVALAIALVMFARYRNQQEQAWENARVAERRSAEARDQRAMARAEALAARDAAARSAGHLASLRASQPGREYEALIEGTRAVLPYFDAGAAASSRAQGPARTLARTFDGARTALHAFTGATFGDPPPEAVEGLWAGLARIRSSVVLAGVEPPYALSSDGARIVGHSQGDIVVRDFDDLSVRCVIPDRSALPLRFAGTWLLTQPSVSPIELFDADCVKRSEITHPRFEDEPANKLMGMTTSASADMLVTATYFGFMTWTIDPSGVMTPHRDLRHRRHYAPRFQAHEGLRHFASVSDVENKAIVWDMRSGTKLRTLDDGDAMTNLALSRDGLTLVTTGARTARVWDVSTGLRRATLLHEREISGLILSEDGEHVAIASGVDIALWRTQTGAMVANLQGHTIDIRSLALSPDGTQLASASSDGTARLWSMSTHTPIAVLRGHEGAVGSVQFTPDNASVLTTGADRSVRLWDLTSGEPMLALHGHGHDVRAGAFCDDGEQLATADRNGELRLWDARKGVQLGQTITAPASIEALDYAGASRRLAAAGADGHVRLWDTSNPEDARLLASYGDGQHMFSTVAFTPDGRVLAAGGGAREVALLDARDLELIATLEHADTVAAVAISADGRYLVSAGWDGRIGVWDLERRRALVHSEPALNRWVSLAFARDGSLVAAGGDSGQLAIWDLGRDGKTLDLRWRRALDSVQLDAVVLTPDGRELISADSDGKLRFWRTNTGEQTREHVEHDGRVWTLALSGSGTHLLSAGHDRIPRIWRWRVGDLLAASCKNLNTIGDDSFEYCANLERISARKRRFRRD